GRRRLRGGPPPRVRQGQRPPRQALPQARPQGVHQGGGTDGDRVRRHGVRRLLRQAHLHPHQQHHRRLRLDGKHHFVGSCLANVYSNVCVLCLICGITVGQLIMGLSSILTL
uniref:Uncharacterized protein n=1 Tax=Triticum urartu TaxID=4572 RepID=A0A8R7RFD6_TRIUA